MKDTGWHCESGSVSRGSSEHPGVDRNMTSSELWETRVLVTTEPVTFVDPELTKATLKKKQCGELLICPFVCRYQGTVLFPK